MQLPHASPVSIWPDTSDQMRSGSNTYSERRHAGAIPINNQQGYYTRHLPSENAFQVARSNSSTRHVYPHHASADLALPNRLSTSIGASEPSVSCSRSCCLAHTSGSNGSFYTPPSYGLQYHQYGNLASPTSDPVIMHDDMSMVEGLDVPMEDLHESLPGYNQSQLVANATGSGFSHDVCNESYFSTTGDMSPSLGVESDPQHLTAFPPLLLPSDPIQPRTIHQRGRSRAASFTALQQQTTQHQSYSLPHLGLRWDRNDPQDSFADPECSRLTLPREQNPEHLPLRPKDPRIASSRVQAGPLRPRRRSSETRGSHPTARAVRKGPLDPATRRDAAHMRIKGACNYCREHKRKCDGATPCGPCSNAFHRSLLDNPCRGNMAENIAYVALQDDRRWCPQPRKLKDFGISGPRLSDSDCYIPVQLGFGSPLMCKVKTVQVSSIQELTHHHITIVAPKAGMAEPAVEVHKDFVLPVVFSDDFKLKEALSKHIHLLADRDFREFKWYRANFNVLEKIYSLYTYYRDSGDESAAAVLRNALSLLCLIHACDTLITLQDDAVGAIATELILSRFQPDPKGVGMSTCFLRAQLAEVVPSLARESMTEAVKSLFALYMKPRAEKLPLVIATNVLITMALESVIFRGKSPALHRFLHTSTMPVSAEQLVAEEDMSRHPCVSNSEACASILNARYRDYLTQHGQAWLLDPSAVEEHDAAHLAEILGDVPSRFMTELRGLASTASHYLSETAANRELTLDRLTARLFMRP